MKGKHSTTKQKILYSCVRCKQPPPRPWPRCAPSTQRRQWAAGTVGPGWGQLCRIFFSFGSVCQISASSGYCFVAKAPISDPFVSWKAPLGERVSLASCLWQSLRIKAHFTLTKPSEFAREISPTIWVFGKETRPAGQGPGVESSRQAGSEFLSRSFPSRV